MNGPARPIGRAQQSSVAEASGAFWWLRLLGLPVSAALSQPITRHEAREQQKDRDYQQRPEHLDAQQIR
jgi:hypothetical protein